MSGIYVPKTVAGSVKEARKIASKTPGYTQTKKVEKLKNDYKFPQKRKAKK
jgi:hypothetical protein